MPALKSLFADVLKFDQHCHHLLLREDLFLQHKLHTVLDVNWARVRREDGSCDQVSLETGHSLTHGHQALGAGAQRCGLACAQVRAIDCILDKGRLCCLCALCLNIWFGNDPRSLVLQGWETRGMTATIMRTVQTWCRSGLWQPDGERRRGVGKSQVKRRGGDGSRETESRDTGNKRRVSNGDCVLMRCWRCNSGKT